MFWDNRSFIFDSLAFVSFRCLAAFLIGICFSIFLLFNLDLVLSISTGGSLVLLLFTVILNIKVLVEGVDHLLDFFIVLFLLGKHQKRENFSKIAYVGKARGAADAGRQYFRNWYKDLHFDYLGLFEPFLLQKHRH